MAPACRWSAGARTGGDLRIAHFVGLHAMQLLPLVAAVLARFAPGLHRDARVRVVRVLGVGYLGLVLALTWQALRAQPLLSPDTLTLAVVTALAVGTAVALLVATNGRHTGSRPVTQVATPVTGSQPV